MIVETVTLTAIFETITIVGRMLFGSVKEKYKKLKLKVRIHHGYIGILLLAINLFYNSNLIYIIGLSLLFSDIIHHFIILPIWIGKTEFP